MKHQIESFIKNLGSNKKIITFDKAATKQAIVLKLLSLLEWDIFNVEEVCPDYSVDSYMFSYALLANRKNKVFIDVKRVDEKLDPHQKDLMDIAFKEGVDLCILTNGGEWRFYLISVEGEWQQKWFHSIDLLKQEPVSIADQFIDLLTKDKISKGQTLKVAKAWHQSYRQKVTTEFVSQAWNQIISQPNKILVELLSECVQQLCGYNVGASEIENFLKRNLDKWLIEDMSNPRSALLDTKIEIPIPKDEPADTDSKATQVESNKKRGAYEGKSIKSFTFDGDTHEVFHWEEVLTTLCNHFATAHKKDFEKVLWISGQNRACFSRNEEDLDIPEKIGKTDIYLETKLSPDEIVKTAKLLLTEFGYAPDMLMIAAE
jgi:hypothetical protein